MKKIEGSTSHVFVRRHRLLMLLASLGAIVALTGCATFNQPAPAPVTVPQIISMVDDGVPASDIIAKMKASRTVYRLKASRLADLEEMGVPAKVIDYMQKTYIQAVKEEARREEWRYWTMEDDYGWYGGPFYDWTCDTCFD